MTSLLIQFHAAPEELAAFVCEVANAFELNVALLRFRPSFSCEPVHELAKLAQILDLKNGGEEVVLSVSPIDIAAANQLRFYDKNPGCISFGFARWLPGGLKQSSMGFKTDDEATIAVGKEIAKRLKKITRAGVRVTNPKTGESAIAKTFRYTEGALRLERDGVQMLPDGGNLIKLGVEC